MTSHGKFWLNPALKLLLFPIPFGDFRVLLASPTAKNDPPMIQALTSKDGMLSIIVRMGVQYISFQLDPKAQDWVNNGRGNVHLSALDLITLVLGGKARVAPTSSTSRFLKRIGEDRKQLRLQLDFTQSFLSCEQTGQRQDLRLCLIRQRRGYDIKLLARNVSRHYRVEASVPVEELTLDHLKSFVEKGHISQEQPTVRRLKH